MKVKDKLMVYITLGVLSFIGLVLLGEYLVIVYATNQTGEVIGTEPDVIALVQNALVGQSSRINCVTDAPLWLKSEQHSCQANYTFVGITQKTSRTLSH
jgi:hypothetical protein